MELHSSLFSLWWETLRAGGVRHCSIARCLEPRRVRGEIASWRTWKQAVPVPARGCCRAMRHPLGMDGC